MGHFTGWLLPSLIGTSVGLVTAFAASAEPLGLPVSVGLGLMLAGFFTICSMGFTNSDEIANGTRPENINRGVLSMTVGCFIASMASVLAGLMMMIAAVLIPDAAGQFLESLLPGNNMA